MKGSRDDTKAVFDARSTAASSSMTLSQQYVPAVTILANPADTSTTKKNPIALRTINGGIDIS